MNRLRAEKERAGISFHLPAKSQSEWLATNHLGMAEEKKSLPDCVFLLYVLHCSICLWIIALVSFSAEWCWWHVDSATLTSFAGNACFFATGFFIFFHFCFLADVSDASFASGWSASKCGASWCCWWIWSRQNPRATRENGSVEEHSLSVVVSQFPFSFVLQQRSIMISCFLRMD